jgi:hypothetical protein
MPAFAGMTMLMAISAIKTQPSMPGSLLLAVSLSFESGNGMILFNLYAFFF